MGALQIGPLANNVMGGRLGAKIVASKMGAYENLSTRLNRFSVLDDSDDSSSESDSDSSSQ
jgi:hypothetical protein